MNSATRPALPAVHEFSAPEAWRTIDFISDLHLSPALPLTTQAWARYLHNTSADAVFMLGDLFELWVGDDTRSLPFARECVEHMSSAAGQRCLAFMVGNRDFLLGPAMLQDCGLVGLPDPSALDAWGRRVLLSHGDALCLSDTAYQAFRQQVRDARWQNEFLARPLAERLQIAAGIRQQSQSRRQFDGDLNLDIDASEALAWLQTCASHELVHGHTHRPGDDLIAPGFKRHVLSDWDLDGVPQRAEVLRLTRDGFQRLPPHEAGPG